MPSIFDVGSVVDDVIGAVGKAADRLFTSDEERQKAKRLMRKVEARMQDRLLEVKEQLIQRRGDAVKAEIEGESWLQRNWRPLVMLAFAGLVGAYWLGLAPADLPQYAVVQMYGLVKLGLGGYVIGRSAEKVVRTAGEKWQKGKEAEAGRRSTDQ